MVRILMLALGLLLLAPPEAVNAQNVPGSYRKTCDTCRVQDNALLCICQRKNGARQPTFVWLNKCPRPFEVINDNGDLYCVSADQLPPGSYKRTCGKCSMKGNTLICNCQRRDGSVKKGTKLNVRNCNWVANNSGNLYCER